MLLLLVLLWAALASPIAGAAFLAGRALKRRAINSPGACLVFGLTVALLLAPVPTPIITVFVPNGVIMFSREYWAELSGSGPFGGWLWPWLATSIAVMAPLCCFVALHWLPGKVKRG